MSTKSDNNKSRKLNEKDFPGNTLTFGDKAGQYPTKAYENASSVNATARQNSSSNELAIPGTSAGIDLSDFNGGIESQYPLNQVIETESGHVIEYNDTKGSERILIKHAQGSGVDMRPDGSVVVNASGRGLVEVAVGGHKLIVTGDGQLSYSGNLTLNVGGDFNLNVGGAFNVQAKEETKTINGPSRDFYTGNKYTTIKGSRKDTFTEDYTSIVLGKSAQFVKGDFQTAIEGAAVYASKGVMSSSSETQMTSSSPDINIGAESISVFGASGTIGGENVIMHNYNMFSGHSIWATETVNAKTVTATHTMNAVAFNGDLFGTASSALEANVAAASGGGGASQTSSSDASSDTTGQTAKATSAVIADYAKSNYGTKKVSIDEGDYYKSTIDKSTDTDNATDRPLSLSQVRAKKRDVSHHTNSNFNNYAVTAKTLNPKHSDTVPPAVGEVRDPKALTIAAVTPLPGGDSKTRVIPAQNKSVTISVDPQYNPNGLQFVSAATKIDNGISLSEFAYGKGDPHGIDKSYPLGQRVQILRNLYLHGKFLSRIRNDKREFKGYNLQVVEGLYIPHSTETITSGGILDLRKQGRAVVYELLGINGIIDKDKTFELASWMAKTLIYDKIILDYDMYDPFGDLNVQIILITPEVPPDYKITAKMETETVYNGKKQDNGFMMIQSEKVEPANPDYAIDTAPPPYEEDKDEPPVATA